MLSVSSAPHAAPRWRIKATSTCTINCIVTFMLVWRLWIVHHQTRTAWCQSHFSREYSVFAFIYLPPSKPLTGHFCVQLCLPERGRTKRNLFSPSLHKSSAWKVSPKILQLNVKSYLSRDSFFVPLYFSSSVKAPNLKPENFIMKSVLMCFRLVPKLERLQKFSN